MATSLGLSSDEFINYAHGGSPTIGYLDYLSSYWSAGTSEAPELATLLNLLNSLKNGKWLQVSLEQQVRVLLKNYHSFRDSDIIVVSGGGNDYLNEYWDPGRIVRAQADIVRTLLDHGAGIVVWGTLPDITRTPCLQNSESYDTLRRIVRRHNQLVDEAIENIRPLYPGQLLLFVDNAALFESLLVEARRKGMKTRGHCTGISFVGCFDKDSMDIRNSAGVEPCGNPDNFFFWDSVHPSSRVSNWINTIACHLLTLLNVEVQCENKDNINVSAVFERAINFTESKTARQQLNMLLMGQCPAL